MLKPSNPVKLMFAGMWTQHINGVQHHFMTGDCNTEQRAARLIPQEAENKCVVRIKQWTE